MYRNKGGSAIRNIRGMAFRVAGLILGIVGVLVSVNAIVFSAIGMHRARQCKHCKMEGTFQ